MKYLLTIAGIIGVIFTAVFLFVMLAAPDIEESTFRKTTLMSKDKSSKLYIKSENWGLTGDKQITVISTDEKNEFKADPSKDFVFNGIEPFLYKTEEDSLFVYTLRNATVSLDFKSKWTVKQVEIENSEMMVLRTNSELTKF